MSAVAGPVKFNTQVEARPADIDAHQGPLRDVTVRLNGRLAQGMLSVDDYQREARAIVTDPGHRAELGPWIERALAERRDQVLYRKSHDGRRDTLQLLYVEPGEIHPPHCHHNLVSNQACVHGRMRGREYDRVARLDEQTLLLRLAEDRWFGLDDVMQTTEVHRNGHWFAAGDEPAVILNYYLLGYQAWTFDPPAENRRKGRRMVDPTAGCQRDGLIVAREISMEEGYDQFGGRAIDEFPVPGVGVR